MDFSLCINLEANNNDVQKEVNNNAINAGL